MVFVSDEKKPIEQAVDLALYAPIGFVLEARRLLPSFVERGRQQVTMAKMVGQFAVTHGQATAAKKLGKVQGQAEGFLAELGLAPQAAGERGPHEEATSASRPVAAPGSAAAPRSAAAVTPASLGAPTAADLPIAGYDSLAASQVIPRLTGLTHDELRAVEAYETAHRGRKTILGKLTQLREA
jgi:hypothetical protein